MLTLVLVSILVSILPLQRREEATAVQVLLDTQFIEEPISLLLVPAGSATSYAVRKAATLVLLWNEVLLVLIEVGVIKVELVWVVGAGSSFTVDVCLLNDFVVVRYSKLLVGSISCCYNNLSAAWVASSFASLVADLASTSQRLLPSWIIVTELRHHLALIGHRMSDWIHIKVLELVLVWNLHITLLVYGWEHPIFQPWLNELDYLFINIQLEQDLIELAWLSNTRKSCDCLQSKVPDFLFGVIE